MMELFVFLDLDDTIFQTKRKCPPNKPITPAALGKDGLVASFFTNKQAKLFNLLYHKTRMIPTTARNHRAFLLTNIAKFDYAIINHGGIILNSDGSIHQHWFNKISLQLQTVLPKLKNLENDLKHKLTQDNSFRISLCEDLGLTFYLLIKHEKRDHDYLKKILTDIIEPYLKNNQLDFYCHLNSNNLAILPHFLNKAYAVSFIKKELDKIYSEYLTFGIGDSLTDMPYMQLCDYFMTPTNSQIMQECINPHTLLLDSEV